MPLHPVPTPPGGIPEPEMPEPAVDMAWLTSRHDVLATVPPAPDDSPRARLNAARIAYEAAAVEHHAALTGYRDPGAHAAKSARLDAADAALERAWTVLAAAFRDATPGDPE